jgi:predicted Rossmann fold flavoprotein
MASSRKAKKPDSTHPIIIIGGGPAGMTAAQIAAGHFDNVVLFDKNPEPGKKLRSLASETIYVSENLSCEKAAQAFGDNEKFILPAFQAFGFRELKEHLAAMNIKVTPNGNNHVMVLPEATFDMPARLRAAAEAAGVAIKKSSKVTDILFSKGQATAVVINSVEHPASAVIMACGSVASPARGATDDGYEFARKAGHTITPVRPALVGLETVEKYGKSLADTQFDDCRIQVTRDDESLITDRGSLKFTSYGIEGDLVLTHSARIIELLARDKGQQHRVEIHIDMIPEMKKKDLEGWMAQQTADNPKITVGSLFEDHIPDRLRGVMGKIVRIHSDKPVSNLSYLERKMLLLWVKDFRVTISRPRPFNETRGVVGGVSTAEIDPQTMRSAKIKNLYFAGEVLDLPGPWGGYNFQMAFSTGFLAGLSAAQASIK